MLRVRGYMVTQNGQNVYHVKTSHGNSYVISRSKLQTIAQNCCIILNLSSSWQRKRTENKTKRCKKLSINTDINWLQANEESTVNELTKSGTNIETDNFDTKCFLQQNQANRLWEKFESFRPRQHRMTCHSMKKMFLNSDNDRKLLTVVMTCSVTASLTSTRSRSVKTHTTLWFAAKN